MGIWLQRLRQGERKCRNMSSFWISGSFPRNVDLASFPLVHATPALLRFLSLLPFRPSCFKERLSCDPANPVAFSVTALNGSLPGVPGVPVRACQENRSCSGFRKRSLIQKVHFTGEVRSVGMAQPHGNVLRATGLCALSRMADRGTMDTSKCPSGCSLTQALRHC